jgi:hypothetical protein
MFFFSLFFPPSWCFWVWTPKESWSLNQKCLPTNSQRG